MLTLLKIRNIALIEELSVEFAGGLNLLTGETGSGKSIIVDSLAALTGDRVSSDLIKEGRDTASIEGLFELPPDPEFSELCAGSGIELAGDAELIVRRDLSAAGRNRVFINGQLATQGLLKRLGSYLVDIHGQGEQASLYGVSGHRDLLDDFAGVTGELQKARTAYEAFESVTGQIAALERDTADKLQLTDVLNFQVNEISSAGLKPGEDAELETEKHRLANIEKLTSLSSEAFALLYDNAESTTATLEKAQRRVDELSTFEPRFAEYAEGVANARAVIEDLAIALRDHREHLEFSPGRLEQIEDRLAEISRLKRKYGGSIETALEHLAASRERLGNIESSELREKELRRELDAARAAYLAAARELHKRRFAAARKFEKEVEKELAAVALEKARFEVRIDSDENDASFTPTGIDRVEFYFSANPGESPRPLVRVASGGEASRLMLILKTTARGAADGKTAVFDEIDVGIGGRVAEAVGRKLKQLAAKQQVLCVTHQPQIASLADRHLVVEKTAAGGRTSIGVRTLDDATRIEEIARMLAGEQVTEAARENARAMLAGAK